MVYEIDKPKKDWVTLDGEEIAPKLVNNIFTSNIYTIRVKPFKTPEYFRVYVFICSN